MSTEGTDFKRNSVPFTPADTASAGNTGKANAPKTTSAAILNIFKKKSKKNSAVSPLGETRKARVKSMSSRFLGITATLSPKLQKNYPELFHALGEFNQNKSRKNLNALVRCLKRVQNPDKSLFRRLESEVKLQLLLLLNHPEGGIQLSDSGRITTKHLNDDFLTQDHPNAKALRSAIDELKANPSDENFHLVLTATAIYEREFAEAETKGMLKLIDDLSALAAPRLLENSLALEEFHEKFLHKGRSLTSAEKTLNKALKTYEK